MVCGRVSQRWVEKKVWGGIQRAIGSSKCQHRRTWIRAILCATAEKSASTVHWQRCSSPSTSVEDYFRPKYYEFIDHTVEQLEAPRFSSEDMKTYGSLKSILLSTELSGDAHIVLSKYPGIDNTYLESELPMFLLACKGESYVIYSSGDTCTCIEEGI